MVVTVVLTIGNVRFLIWQKKSGERAHGNLHYGCHLRAGSPGLPDDPHALKQAEHQPGGCLAVDPGGNGAVNLPLLNQLGHHGLIPLEGCRDTLGDFLVEDRKFRCAPDDKASLQPLRAV